MLQVIRSKDGSPTLFDDSIDECYHSRNGALSESKHVFIHHGLEFLLSDGNQEIHLLEVGLGTGLNALLSWKTAEQKVAKIHYTALEPYPVPMPIISKMASTLSSLTTEDKTSFLKIHQAVFEKTQYLSPHFSIFKSKAGLENYQRKEPFHLIYFDAFSPEKAPHLWTEAIFENLHRQMYPKAALVTYCAKGSIKRLLKKTGFLVETLPGAAGKREMIRAIKC